METLPELDYDGQVLLGGGCVVAYFRPFTPLDSYVSEGLACMVVPGSSCDVLLVFTEVSAVRFAAALDQRVREAQAARGAAITGLSPALKDDAKDIVVD